MVVGEWCELRVSGQLIINNYKLVIVLIALQSFGANCQQRCVSTAQFIA